MFSLLDKHRKYFWKYNNSSCPFIRAHISQESEHHLESQNSMWETIDFYQPGKWNERENDIAGHREFSSGQQRLSFMGIVQKLQMLLG